VDIRFFDQSRPQSERDALDTTCPKVSNVVAYETVVAGLKPGRYAVNVFMGRGSADPSPASAIASETIELKPYRVYAKAIVSLHNGAGGSKRVLVFTRDGARLSVDSVYSLSPDTLRLTTPASINADLTDGEVHFLSEFPLDLKASITNGPALSVTGTGRHIVLVRGGVGIDIKKD
jgi:hypothetical protein